MRTLKSSCSGLDKTIKPWTRRKLAEEIQIINGMIASMILLCLQKKKNLGKH